MAEEKKRKKETMVDAKGRNLFRYIGDDFWQLDEEKKS